MNELIERFSLDWINKSGAIFDLKKLDFINSNYIKKLNFEEFEAVSEKFLWEKILELKEKNFSQYKKNLEFAQNRIKKLSEINDEIKIFVEPKNFSDSENFSEFKENVLFNEKMWVWEDSVKEILQNLIEFVSNLEENFLEWEAYSEDILKEKIIEFIKLKNSKNWAYMWPLRVCLSREKQSASPFEMMPILWKKWSIERIEEILNFFD